MTLPVGSMWEPVLLQDKYYTARPRDFGFDPKRYPLFDSYAQALSFCRVMNELEYSSWQYFQEKNFITRALGTHTLENYRDKIKRQK